MVWAAFDRAIEGVEEHGLHGPVDEWRAIRDQVREEIMTQGYDAERNTFTQHYDTREVDASLLVLPLVRFIDGDDPKMVGTIKAVEEDLMRGGLLMRYRTSTRRRRSRGWRAPVPGVLVLAGLGVRPGRPDGRRQRPDGPPVGLANDVGLLSEEYDVRENRMVGNFPQAFSHLALVGAAMNIERARETTPRPDTTMPT